MNPYGKGYAWMIDRPDTAGRAAVIISRDRLTPDFKKEFPNLNAIVEVYLIEHFETYLMNGDQPVYRVDWSQIGVEQFKSVEKQKNSARLKVVTNTLWDSGPIVNSTSQTNSFRPSQATALGLWRLKK